MMKRHLSAIVLGVVGLTLLAACAPVPLTGRRQLSLIPDSQMN